MTAKFACTHPSGRSEQSAVTAAAKQEEIKAGHASIKRLGSEIEKMRSEMVKLTKKRDKACPKEVYNMHADN